MAVLSLPGIALVTGASKGIGKATCLSFAASGVSGLVLHGRNKDDLERTASEAEVLATNPKFSTMVIVGDISVETDIIDLVSKSVETFGRIDYAVNNAGYIAQEFKPFVLTPTTEVDALTLTNQRGTFLCTREEIKAMLKQPKRDIQGLTALLPETERGCIVNVSSSTSVTPLPMSGSYNPTTNARVGITKSAALDHASDGVRVNALLPGFTVTDGFMAHPNATPELAEQFVSQNPMKRLATPADVADAVIFLCSPLARFITGETLLVDGGRTLA